jgi:hypothetical protein
MRTEQHDLPDGTLWRHADREFPLHRLGDDKTRSWA